MRTFGKMTLATLAVIASAPAQAAAIIVPDSGDSGWLFASLLLGLALAVPGILLYLIGSNGWASAQRILTSAVAGFAMVTLLTLVIGYSLMFDLTPGLPIGDVLGGSTNWMLNLMGTLREGTTVPETGFVLFQLGFVLLAVAMLSGALAPRARPGWLLGFTALWFLLVLVPVTRFIWGGGWLAQFGALDSVGGLTIFYCTGVSAMIALTMIGAPDDATPAPADHGARMIGAVLLLFGMVALAGGSTLGASDNSAVAMLAMLTAAMTGTLVLAAIRRSLDADALAGGMIAGTIAAATAGDGISVGGAMLTGALAALAFALTPRLMPRRIALADPGSTIAGLTGAAKTGAILFAVFLAFSPFGGSGYPDGMTMTGQLLAQLVAILAIAGWSIIGTAIAALMAGLVLPMRAKD